jgi:hypothetical protein
MSSLLQESGSGDAWLARLRSQVGWTARSLRAARRREPARSEIACPHGDE